MKPDSGRLKSSVERLEKIMIAQQIGGGESADAPAHDDHIMFCGRRRTCKCFAIAHLMADGVFFAVQRGCRGSLRLCNEGKIDWTSRRDRSGYNEFDEV